MLIAGISTLLFNGNPLLRFDGYYILADLIEIPNLRQRAPANTSATCSSASVFGVPDAPRVEASRGERVWLVVYAIASFVYRIFIMFVHRAVHRHAVLHRRRAARALGGARRRSCCRSASCSLPALQPGLRRNRPRAIATSAGGGRRARPPALALPVPLLDRAPGRGLGAGGGAGARRHRRLRRQACIARPGARVARGEPLIEAATRSCAARRLLKAQRERARGALLRRARRQPGASANRAREDEVGGRRARARARAYARPRGAQPLRRYFRAARAARTCPGASCARASCRLRDPRRTRHRTRLVPQDQIDLVRATPSASRRSWPSAWARRSRREIVREMPRASDRLPSLALAHAGGGDVALDPTKTSAPKAMQTHFEFEVELVAGASARRWAGACTCASSTRARPSPSRCGACCSSSSSSTSPSYDPGAADRLFARFGFALQNAFARTLPEAADFAAAVGAASASLQEVRYRLRRDGLRAAHLASVRYCMAPRCPAPPAPRVRGRAGSRAAGSPSWPRPRSAAQRFASPLSPARCTPTRCTSSRRARRRRKRSPRRWPRRSVRSAWRRAASRAA